MNRYEKLMARARAGEPILIDGATGSESLDRGAPELDNGWSGGAVLTHPEIVRDIHLDYLNIGADFIASNTFATGRNILIDAGVPDDFEAVNRRAVELAVEARGSTGDASTGSFDHVVVAGGISNWSFSGDRPSLAQLKANTVEQATIMRDAGADLFSLEMMVDLPRMTATLDAVSEVGLPVWVGFSIGPEAGHDASALGEHIELREGGLLADAVRAAADYEAVDAMCIMHTDVRLAERSVAALSQHWDGPVGVYAHAAAWVDGRIVHHNLISPEDYAAHVPAWQAAGATMIGGCCGIGPEHLRRVASALG